MSAHFGFQQFALCLGACLASAVACSSDPTQPNGSGGTGAGPASGGTSSGGASSGGSPSTGGTFSGGASNGGSPSSGGMSSGGMPGTGGSSSGAGGAATGGQSTGGAGAGGASTGGTTSGGIGGGALGGANASGGAAGAAPTGGSAGVAGASGGGAAVACPPDAFFCSGFEDAGLPTGATYSSNLSTVEIAIDKAVHNTGSQSVQVHLGSGYVYRMLSVPAASKFWFRAYLRTDVAIDAKAQAHESFMGANWGMDKGVDIVQEQCQVAVNINDNPVLGSNGMNPPINCPADGQKISANTWYCFEGFFDGMQGDMEIFVDKKSIIKGAGIAAAKQSFTNFRFGYVEYNGTNRTVWYDDVATGPNRIPCL